MTWFKTFTETFHNLDAFESMYATPNRNDDGNFELKVRRVSGEVLTLFECPDHRDMEDILNGLEDAIRRGKPLFCLPEWAKAGTAPAAEA